jgi:hypothetical protein
MEQPKADTVKKTPGFYGKPGRSGPTVGALATVNGLKNGTRISKRLVVGELPKQLLAVRREARSYRRFLEGETLQVKDEINTTDAHLIDTASAATIHAGICRWLLRQKISTMTTADILACSRELIRAKQVRDAAVKALELGKLPEPLSLTEYVVESKDDGKDDGHTESGK